ncbi:MAG: hypothetical protein VX804_05035 [Candidatus Thermoplasmatota archaeon]|nr:hypothetical protein [Candidatus Thermoplasmatota archaeon]
MEFLLLSDIMKFHLWISIIFLIPTSGCLGWGEDVEISSGIQEEPLRIVFESPTLDRSEDLGATVKLDEQLRTSPVLLFWVSPHCGGCHNWTQNIIDEGHYARWNDSNELQLLSIHRYIEFEDSESMMEVYGNQSSSEYTPWPILVPDTNSRAIDLDSGMILSESISEAFDNPPTPSLFLINQEAEIIWKAESYYYDELEIQEIDNILEQQLES